MRVLLVSGVLPPDTSGPATHAAGSGSRRGRQAEQSTPVGGPEELVTDHEVSSVIGVRRGDEN